MTAEIIGRDAELSIVRAFLERPVDGPRALVLVGEPGIGKSTLWAAGVIAARNHSLRVLASHPAEGERTLPNVVLGDLFGEVPSHLLAELPEPRRRAFEAALLLHDAPDRPVDPRALGVAITTLLPALADGRPLVIAIDDDQWLDTSSAAQLRFAIRRSAGRPILLLLARRFDDARTGGLETELEHAAVERLPVGPLSLGAVQHVLQARLGRALPRNLLARIHEESGGNPFYALELANARASHAPQDAIGPLVVPPSLDRLVAARLGALDADARRELMLVAAQGRLPTALLRPLGIVAATFDSARDARVVEVTDTTISFTHPLLASALYQGASSEERRAAHRRLAAVVDDPVDRGRQLALAEDAPDAVLAGELESAASAARERGLSFAAAELLEHARRLTPPEALDDRSRRSIATARAYMEAGEGSRARTMIDALLDAMPPGNRRAEALLLRSDLGVPGATMALLDQALVEAIDDPGLQAAIHAGLAEEGRFTRGRVWAEEHAETSLQLAEHVDDDSLRATALAVLARLRHEGGDVGALELAEHAVRLAAGLPDPRRVKGAGWSVGDVLVWTASLVPARAWLQQELEAWRDRDEMVRWELLSYLALVEFWAGRWAVARDYVAQAGEISVEYGIEPPQDVVSSLIAMHEGDLETAAGDARRALHLAHGQLLPYQHAIIGICELWGGDPQLAITAFAEAEATADTRGWVEPFLRWWRGDYAEALLRIGRLDDATDLIDDWDVQATRLGRERVLADVLRCRGLTAAARGELPIAMEVLELAADRHEAVGDPFGWARARLASGICQRRTRQKRSARTSIEAALARFDALGAAGWAATARAELGRIGGRTRIEGLSPSELRVAGLVAEGRTNREIAAALFLSETTVASHLSRIYAKLGIRSRTELARQALVPPDTSDADNIRPL